MAWEILARELLNRPYQGKQLWRRVPGSGALGTIMQYGQLKGDLMGKYPFLPFTFRAEAKVGYGGAKQIAMKREWFDKIREEAAGNFNELPCVLMKYSGVHAPNTQHVIAFDFETYQKIIDVIESMYDEIVELHKLLREKNDGEQTSL